MTCEERHAEMRRNPVARRLWSLSVCSWPSMGRGAQLFTCRRCRSSFLVRP